MPNILWTLSWAKQLRLMLLTNWKAGDINSQVDLIRRAVLGGVTSVQVREKDPHKALELGLALQPMLKWHGVPLIMNDFVHIAAQIGADGVHLGQKDMRAAEARAILGPEAIIGVSIEHLDHLKETNALLGKYYVTASAVFKSRTKEFCEKYWGLAGLKQVVDLSVHPVTGIGGITLENIEAVMATGAVGVAVIGAIYNAICQELAAQEFLKVIGETPHSVDVS